MRYLCRNQSPKVVPIQCLHVSENFAIVAHINSQCHKTKHSSSTDDDDDDDDDLHHHHCPLIPTASHLHLCQPLTSHSTASPLFLLVYYIDFLQIYSQTVILFRLKAIHHSHQRFMSKILLSEQCQPSLSQKPCGASFVSSFSCLFSKKSPSAVYIV